MISNQCICGLTLNDAENWHPHDTVVNSKTLTNFILPKCKVSNIKQSYVTRIRIEQSSFLRK